MLAYYPRRVPKISDMVSGFDPQLTTWDDDEFDRLEKIEEYATMML